MTHGFLTPNSAFRIPHSALRDNAVPLWCCVLAAATFLAGPDQAGANEVRVGVARETLTLPRHVPLAGYSRRSGRPSSGVHDPVGARALVIQDERTTVALVSCDLLMVDEHLFDAVRRRLIGAGWPSTLVLMLAGTHTHSGPGAYGTKFLEKISMGHFDPAVFEAIVEGIVVALTRAHAAQQPARSAYLTRRIDGVVKNRSNPSGLVDDELVVQAFYPLQGEAPFAVVVNFSAHPTTLGAWNTELSADYPGVIVQEVERSFPGTTCLFFAGSVGDQAPVKSGSGFERAQWIGQRLAQSALTALHEAHPEVLHRLATAQRDVPLPPARARLGPRLTLPRWFGRRLVDDDATLSAAAVGRIVYLGVPCDLAAALGRDLKEAAHARGLEPVIVGFASDYIGYCVTEELYQTGRYEALMAFNGPTTGPLIVEQLMQMLDDVATSNPSRALGARKQPLAPARGRQATGANDATAP